MPDLRTRLKEEIIFLDGATGTNLQRAGMPTGVCPELWILEHPNVLLELQKSYVYAGSQILYAPTFSGNAIKLEEYGVRERLKEINQRLVSLTRQAAEEAWQERGTDQQGRGGALASSCLVAGNLTMTGRSLTPVGDLDFEELVDCYKEQVSAIAEAGVDLFVVETMMSIQECRAAVLAVKETTDLPVFVTITLEEGGRTLYGTDPVTALITLESLGVDAFGINCSCGPDTLIPMIKELAEYANIPLIAKPNAGIPRLENGTTVFDMKPEEFAEHMKALVDAGASVVGGCCGTDAAYIEAMNQVVSDRSRSGREKAGNGSDDSVAAGDGIQTPRRILTSERGRLEFTLDGPFHIVGERINPTGKKRLQAELLEGSLEQVSEMAREQTAQGASLLDINVGMSGIQEKEMMLKVLEHVGQLVDTPLCIDSSDPKVTEAALRRYPGRALVNSISCEKIKLKGLLPVVKKYGAMFVLLPLRDEGMPKDQQERWENVMEVRNEAYRLGFSKEDIIVDGLVAAVAAEPTAAKDTLATIEKCRQEGLATICGLSNISFGLPDRSYVNSVFLSMAIQSGLTMAIANPSQELFCRSMFAADLLMGKELAAVRYVESCQKLTKTKAVEGASSGKSTSPKEVSGDQSMPAKEVSGGQNVSAGEADSLWEILRQDVLKGRTKQIQEHAAWALASGQDAFELLNRILIPSINEVGELFNQQKYFLPQLILSAQAMEAGVAVLEPELQKNREKSKGPVVVLATVKGDIHDIGKNLVAMMMKNYGFQVIDLGKDVDKETILATAKEHQADVIGLSALMTTTMSYMREVIEAVREQQPDVKVIVGGAAVTEEYARKIEADGYAKDAVGAVDLVKKLLE